MDMVCNSFRLRVHRVLTYLDTLLIALAISSIVISHNVLRRHLFNVITKAPAIPASNQPAFLKYAKFAAWHLRTYLAATSSLFGEEYDEDYTVLPYVEDLEHQLAIAPVEDERNCSPMDTDEWTGGDIALAAERLCDVLYPLLDEREEAMGMGMGTSARLVDIFACLKTEAKDGKGRIGEGYAMAMMEAHMTKGEKSLVGSGMGRLAGGVVYARFVPIFVRLFISTCWLILTRRWTKFAK